MMTLLAIALAVLLLVIPGAIMLALVVIGLRLDDRSSLLRAPWLAIAIHTSRYECYPHYNRHLAGLHVLAWSRCCGDGWRQSIKAAMGYWR